MTETSKELLGIARFKIHEGKLEDFKRLSLECMEIARVKDTGTLQYDVYINDDRLEAVVIERYKDSEALIEHLTNNSHVAKDIFLTGTITGELLGEPNVKLKAMLEGSKEPRLFTTPYLSLQ